MKLHNTESLPEESSRKKIRAVSNGRSQQNKTRVNFSEQVRKSKALEKRGDWERRQNNPKKRSWSKETRNSREWSSKKTERYSY